MQLTRARRAISHTSARESSISCLSLAKPSPSASPPQTPFPSSSPTSAPQSQPSNPFSTTSS
ncbi:hypothetical protein EMPG_15648 [Blastomyces silverae]|uniref:Uncharacterized protein n=1 Tax=Blastomyces silverae TaxID=2060906 RepID=A0A0H1BBW0_9EURO|nr:hypothetical protein EMPG_15648 [Blastomyces silverae]